MRRRCCAARRRWRPDYAAAWMLLGGLLHELGRHRESVERLQPRVTDSSRQCRPAGPASAMR